MSTPTMNTISLADALQMLAEVFDEPIENIRLETTRAQLLGWDSMGALSLMAEFDERFGLELTADASRAMTRIGDVIDMLRRHGALRD